MKKFLLWAVLMVIGLNSCSNEQDGVVTNEITEADVFVASDQYQEYQAIQKNYWNELRNSLKKLNREEKKRYLSLLDSASHTKNKIQQDRYVSLLSQLVGFNYNKQFVKLLIAMQKTFQGKKLSQIDYLKAIQRFNVKMQQLEFTRSSNGEAECVYNCQQTLSIASGQCDYAAIQGWNLAIPWPPYFEEDGYDYYIKCLLDQIDYSAWCDYRACMLNAQMEYDSCKSNC